MAEFRQVVRTHQEEGTELWMAIPVSAATLQQKLLYIDWTGTPPARIAEMCGVRTDSVRGALRKLRAKGYTIVTGKDTIGRPKGEQPTFEKDNLRAAYEDFVADGGEDQW